MKTHEFVISEADTGTRCDVFLTQKELAPTRSQVKRWMEEGLVLVNQTQIKAGYALRVGDIVSVTVPELKSFDLYPQAIPLHIVYEDDDLLVIDKPAGLVVHPAAGNPEGTLVNALLFHLKDRLPTIGGVQRPGIVHRLDKDTSGLLVVAKNDHAHLSLSNQFKERQAGRTYIAFVYGRFKTLSGEIQTLFGRHPTERKRMAVLSDKGKLAITCWRLMTQYDGIAQLEIHLKTGRTHQIRVHLAHIHHPILGDPVYTSSENRRIAALPASLRSAVQKLSRQALHAHRLAFTHPNSGKRLEFSSPLSDDLQALLRSASK